ncbi:DUF4271 domain-containing protein [Catalinimonas niigatensis]|uniref:DUF4271 domain-containing protein n=1 Tax=Catalinimonas niigatensis TaxID=1397264 RepID=UPI002666E426|nr:DUF4271 domain-containing protein [Catalinimonas niigatensis]WPP53143.1 DUF4271 domain-containing protein [Catalinimonas niigatensis]
MRNFCLILICFFLSTSLLRSQALPKTWQEEYEVIKDLNREWVTIDKNDRYVPYIDKSMSGVPVVGAIIDALKYSGNQILICTPANSAILMGKKISSYQQDKVCMLMDVDSLREIYAKESILISIFQSHKNFEEVGFWIVQAKSATGSQLANLSYKREITLLKDFFTVGLLLLLVMYAVLINQYPKIFKNLYNLSRVFSFKVRDDNIRVRLINEAHVMFLIQHCFLLGFLLIILVSTTDLIQINIPYLDFKPYTFSGFMLLWGQMALLVLAAIWLKYIIVMLFGVLFRFRQLRFLYMLDYMRMSLIYSAFLFALLVIVFTGIGYYNDSYFNLIVYLFILLASIRVIVLYFRLFRSASFRNIYLFSYICVAEVIPLLVGLEVLVV